MLGSGIVKGSPRWYAPSADYGLVIIGFEYLVGMKGLSKGSQTCGFFSLNRQHSLTSQSKVCFWISSLQRCTDKPLLTRIGGVVNKIKLLLRSFRFNQENSSFRLFKQIYWRRLHSSTDINFLLLKFAYCTCICFDRYSSPGFLPQYLDMCCLRSISIYLWDDRS